MHRVPSHVLQKLFHHHCITLLPHKKGHPICLGKGTIGRPRNHHYTHNTCTSTGATWPLTTVWAWNRCVTYWDRSNSISMRPINNPLRRHTKTRTMTPLWFPLLKLHLNWTKLPNLWSGIFRSSQRLTMLVTFTQRNWNPCPSIYGSHKLVIL
jgi:hypothetical protein